MNDPLIELLSCVTAARRQQAKRYVLANILLFCIFGFLCGAKSYKALCSFIEERFALLQAAFPSKDDARACAIDLVADHRPG